ncbi:MAG: hypothetical protein PHI18_10215, partial [bacterium]|nr:hypothetical protein [bacterium]
MLGFDNLGAVAPSLHFSLNQQQEHFRETNTGKSARDTQRRTHALTVFADASLAGQPRPHFTARDGVGLVSRIQE